MNRAFDISLIVPTWNSAATLGAALDSVLGQNRSPLEIIVVDDGSTDETMRALAPYREQVRYVYQANAGPSAARNRGLETAQGALIAFLDADDLLPPDALAALCAEFERDSELDVAQGRTCDLRLEDGQLVLAAPHYAFQLGSALFRRTLFDRIGNLQESLRRGEDIDLWMRIQEHNISLRRIPAVTYWYRRYARTNTDVAQHIETLMRLLKDSLDRSRQRK